MKLFPDLQLTTKIINNDSKYFQNKEGNEAIKYILLFANTVTDQMFNYTMTE